MTNKTISIKGIKSFLGLKKKNTPEEPVILCVDIETTAGIYYGWRLGKQHVDWTRIKKEPVICCICWSINGGKVQSATFDMSKYDINAYDDKSDYEIVKFIINIINSADLVVAHNSPFDIGFIRNRIVKHRLPDIAPILIDDTYLKMKLVGMQSHKLDYMLRYLGIGEKRKHEGLDMWKKVSNKDKHALSEMVKYCKDDVEGLRELYNYIKPYIKSNLNLAVFYGKPDICPKCSTEETIIRHGYHTTQTGRFQRYQCTACGWWGRDGQNLISKKVTGTASNKYKR